MGAHSSCPLREDAPGITGVPNRKEQHVKASNRLGGVSGMPHVFAFWPGPDAAGAGSLHLRRDRQGGIAGGAHLPECLQSLEAQTLAPLALESTTGHAYVRLPYVHAFARSFIPQVFVRVRVSVTCEIGTGSTLAWFLTKESGEGPRLCGFRGCPPCRRSWPREKRSQPPPVVAVLVVKVWSGRRGNVVWDAWACALSRHALNMLQDCGLGQFAGGRDKRQGQAPSAASERLEVLCMQPGGWRMVKPMFEVGGEQYDDDWFCGRTDAVGSLVRNGDPWLSCIFAS
ncbi:hypothetical protein DM02DRAFT_655828 [Periconia macrospinosa]|uniref:Uncharacterized protein n=1 Tax=Periconia macrospinosa TaxID=97972 RepID=A0A2V1DPA0_9PLEO|nr:hypothetical protein DM02DRAFT_655828 [Periconia macrospinosa]